MKIWLDIHDGTGEKVGTGPIDAIAFRSSARLNRAGTWAARVPALDARVRTTIRDRYVALGWGIDDSGLRFLGGGPIENIRASFGSDGAPVMEVSGADLLGLLATADAGMGEFIDVKTQLINSISGIEPAWTVLETGGATVPTWASRLVHESVLAALNAAAGKVGFLFRLAPLPSDVRRLEFFMQATSSGVVALGEGEIETNLNACLITSIDGERVASDLANCFYVYGSGNYEARLSLLPATAWPNGESTAVNYVDDDGVVWWLVLGGSLLVNDDSLVEYGAHFAALEFSDIAPLSNNTVDVTNAANYLLLAAIEAGRARSNPQDTYRLQVAGLRGGALLPGQTIYVDFQEWREGARPVDIQTDLVVLEVGTRVDGDGAAISDLTVSTLAAWSMSDSEVVARAVQASVIGRAYPQMNANSYVIPYTKNIDGVALTAIFRFKLGNEVTQLQQILFEFQVLPLESTVKTVGSASVSIASGGGATLSSVNGGAHYHLVNLDDSVLGNAVLYGNSPASTLRTSGGGVIGTTGTDDHAHSLSVPSHDHGISLDISTLYGIFRESLSNTLTLAEIEYRVNGGPWINAAVAVVSGGWLQLDITPVLQDPVTLRPLQADNEVEMRGTIAKTAGIDAQLSVRDIIQAIAYL